MAEFQIHAMPDGKKPEDLPQRGRVNEVCREWLMHEDQAMAYRLQNEEYQTHLGSNRERNQILRQDAPRAREEQIREDHEAAMAQTAYELSLAQQEARDAALANSIAQKLNVEDQETRQKQEEEDMLYARNLMSSHFQEREKVTVRQTRELRQVEREAAYLGINTGNDNVALLARKEPREADLNTSVNSDQSTQSHACAVSSDLSDLSDFCLQPSGEMDEEEQRSLQEEQDAEQDGKRRGDMLHQDQLMAIEAQDRELAKVLQEQERAKAKKAREKARQKALQKKMSRPSQLPEDLVAGAEELNPQSRRRSASPSRDPHDQPGPSHYSPRDSPSHTDYPSSSPAYASPESPRQEGEKDWQAVRGRPLQRPNSLDLPGTSHYAVPRSSKYTRQFSLGKTNKPRLPEPEFTIADIEGESSSSIDQSPAMGFTNIACAIDPTYQRRVMRGELSPSPQTTLQSTSSSSTSSSGTGGIIPSSMMSPISPLPPPVFDDDDDYPVPPYMPIQGQRRTASLEKKRRLKPPKEKSKESCKQQ